MESLIACVRDGAAALGGKGEGWQLIVGDPSFTGWAITALYIVSCLAALSMLLPTQNHVRERRIWLFLVFLLGALAINKELDLQSLLFATARCAARLQGWYEARYIVKLAALGVVVLLCFGVGLWLQRALQGYGAEFRPAVVGVGCIAAFFLLRVVQIEKLDRAFDTPILSGVAILLEVAGPVLIIWAVVRLRLRPVAR